eukprot:gene47308-64121_t
MDRTQPETVSAGVTLLARMSVAAGRLIPVDTLSAATAVNDAPLLVTPIAAQTATEDAAFSFQFAQTTFKDPENTALVFTATTDTGAPLPGWLTFDPATRTFSGTPQNENVGPLSVKVTASDGELTTTSTFTITVQNVNDAPTVANPLADAQGAVGAAFSYSFLNTAFNDVDVSDTLSFT